VGTIDADRCPVSPVSVTSDRHGAVVSVGERVREVGGSSSRTRHLVAISTEEDLGHGVTKVTNWWTIALPNDDYYLTDWTVSYAANTITYDVYGWAPKVSL